MLLLTKFSASLIFRVTLEYRRSDFLSLFIVCYKHLKVQSNWEMS